MGCIKASFSQRKLRKGLWGVILLFVAASLLFSMTTYAGHTLTVESSPSPGVSITGSYPGITPYSVSVTEGIPLTLTAPPRAEGYPFAQWRTEAGAELSDECTYAFSVTNGASPLYAGTAKVDITPPEEDAVDLTNNVLTIHDNIYARVLVLKTDDVSLAIVSLDLILFSSAKVVADAKAQWGVDHVILSSTHTHSSMAPQGLIIGGGQPDWTRMGDPEELIDWPALSSDPWYAETENKIVAAIGEAMTNLFPARIASGQSPFESYYMAHNRRLVNADGSVTMLWANPSRIETEPLDPTIRVIRVDDQSGNPRAILVHYSCHAVMLMNACILSRGYPGAMVDYVEGELGEDCMAMFLQGAEGDIDPYELSLTGDYGFNYVQEAGADLGAAAITLAESIATPESSEASIQVDESLVDIAHRDDSGSTQACVTTVVIDDNLAMVTIPGEPFIQHQLDLAGQSPVANTMMLGLAYCGQGNPFLIYVPTAQAVTEGGYGATECSFVEADAGANMVSQGLASITAAVTRETTVVVEYATTTNMFYVNDTYNAAEDMYCTAAGNSENTGTSPDSPKSSLQEILDTYDLEPGDTIYVDTGTYSVAGSIAIGSEDAGITVIGSTHSNGTNFLATSALDAAAVVQVDSADSVELRNLKISGGWAGVQCLDVAGLELTSLTCQNSGWAGILLDGCDAPAVRCATLDNNGFTGIHVCNCSDTVVENALVCGTPCGIFSDASPSTTVCNTTLHRNGWGVWFGNGSTSGHVQNSIVATIRKRAYYGLYVEDSSQSGFLADYNDHWRTGAANAGYWGGNRKTFSDWQTATGRDAHSLGDDPLFVDADNQNRELRDFSLEAASPCVDAGDSDSAPTVDIEGTGRIGTPDIGAYERPAAAQPPTVDAGVDQTITLSSTASLDATVTDDGLPNPPASVTTTWTMESGPGTVTFGDASAADTTATFSTEGTYVLRLTADDGNLTDYDEMTVAVVADGVFILPARIQAEDYHNQSGAATIATDDVDGVTDIYCMWIDDWTSYNVYVPSAGQYSITVRVRSSGGEFFRIEVDDEDVSGTIGPSLGSSGYSDVVATGVQLSAGAHVLKYYQVNAWGYDNRINWLEAEIDENEAPTVDAGSNQTITLPTNSVLLNATVTDDGQPDPPAAYTLRWTLSSGPETGYVDIGNKYAEDTTVTFDRAGDYVLRLTAEDRDKTAYDEVQITVNEATERITIPDRLEAEDYSDQGEGASYHDTTSGNAGTVYRSDDVDIESCSDTGGGYDVSWIVAGEWLSFNINVPETKPYDIVARVSSITSSRAMHIEVDDVDVTGPMTFDATGGWTNITAEGIHMEVGNHVLKVIMDTGEFKLNYLDILDETYEAYIIQSNTANADIIISSSPTRSAALAAEELQSILADITGATLPIVTSPTGASVHIYVGQSSYTDALGISTTGLAHDAYKIISGSNWIAFVGHDQDYTPIYPYGGGSTVEADWDTMNSPYLWAYPYCYTTRTYAYDSDLDIWNSDGKGSINAVYAFLYDLGCRWYFPGTAYEVIPSLNDIGLPAVNRTIEPNFPMRELFQYYNEFTRADTDNVKWQLRLGLNDGRDSVGLGPRGHGIQYVVGREEYHTLHPEYYAIWDGSRQFDYMGGTPCLSSTGLLAENVEFVETLLDHYGEPMVNVSPSDGYWNLCECALCEGKEAIERGNTGRLSDYVFAYVNALAEDIYVTHPEKQVNCLAYTTYYLPPEDIETMSPNIVITFCRWRSWFEDPDMALLYQDGLHDWMVKLPSDQFFIWDYYLHPRPPVNDFTGIPVYFPWIIRNDLRSLNGLSLGDYIEVQRNWPDWNLTYHALAANHLNVYLTARLYWDANQDVNALLEEYYTRFYGDAADEMKIFVEYCEANWLQAAIDIGNDDFTRIHEMRTLLNAAISSATGVYADRVDILNDFLAAAEARED